jgi:hypothetical protein
VKPEPAEGDGALDPVTKPAAVAARRQKQRKATALIAAVAWVELMPTWTSSPGVRQRRVGPPGLSKYQRPLSAISNCPASTGAMAGKIQACSEAGSSGLAMRWLPVPQSGFAAAS